MQVEVKVASKEEFLKISEEVHWASFNEERLAEHERFNYALICHNEEHGMAAYSTILEIDGESAYMQNGGTFPTIPKFLVVKSYMSMIAFLKKNYPVITTRIFNTNTPMLKLAIAAGFLIHGVEYYTETENFKGGILLNLHLESDCYNA